MWVRERGGKCSNMVYWDIKCQKSSEKKVARRKPWYECHMMQTNHIGWRLKNRNGKLASESLLITIARVLSVLGMDSSLWNEVVWQFLMLLT